MHRYGLLTASLRPAAARVAFRTLWRPRAPLLAHRAPPVLPRHQALLQMHLPLAHALSALTGLPGQRLIRALVASEREPQPRAALRHSRGQQEAAESALALTGPWREEPLVGLPHARALFDVSTTPRSACEAQSERVFSVIKARFETPEEVPEAVPLPTPPRRTPPAPRKNAPEVHTRAPILRIPGVDRVARHGLSDSIAQTLVSEIGTAMSQWPDAQHCCAWRGRAPTNAIAGGKGLKSRTRKNRPRAAPAFRLAAQAVMRSHCACGAFSRRLKGRLGPAQALVATAHTSAQTV